MGAADRVTYACCLNETIYNDIYRNGNDIG
jgi:hypothetical protein